MLSDKFTFFPRMYIVLNYWISNLYFVVSETAKNIILAAEIVSVAFAFS